MNTRSSSRLPAASSTSLRSLVGDIDIYLFDQIQKGRLEERRRILDAGCGRGRNLVYFLQSGYEVSAVDSDEAAVKHVQRVASELVPDSPNPVGQVAAVEELPFEANSFDAVFSSAVLHFARDEDHFERMVRGMWRVLAPDGLLFARLASTIGLEDKVQRIQERRYRLPDGTERFLVDESLLLRLTEQLGAKLFDPIKTTNVQNLRCMTTWVLHKPESQVHP